MEMTTIDYPGNTTSNVSGVPQKGVLKKKTGKPKMTAKEKKERGVLLQLSRRVAPPHATF